MELFYFVIQQMMYFSIPLLIVALGGLFSERSGVINIALEGTMIIGAFCGIFFISVMQQTMPGQTVLILGMLIAMASGMLISLVHAYAAINMKADQTISGTAINIFAPAFVIFVARAVQGVQQVYFVDQFRIDSVPILGDIPVIGPMLFQKTYITNYIGIAILVISWLVLYKTRFGLRLRACGEHPQAADSVGINVYKMRYAGVLISGGGSGRPGVHHPGVHKLQRHRVRLRLPRAGRADLRPVETLAHRGRGALLRSDENHLGRIQQHPVPGGPGHPQQHLQDDPLCRHPDPAGLHRPHQPGAPRRGHPLRQGQPIITKNTHGNCGGRGLSPCLRAVFH